MGAKDWLKVRTGASGGLRIEDAHTLNKPAGPQNDSRSSALGALARNLAVRNSVCLSACSKRRQEQPSRPLGVHGAATRPQSMGRAQTMLKSGGSRSSNQALEITPTTRRAHTAARHGCQHSWEWGILPAADRAA